MPMKDPKSLQAFRKEIDKIDDEIIRLLNARARHVIEIGKLKKAQDSQANLHTPAREAEIVGEVVDDDDQLRLAVHSCERRFDPREARLEQLLLPERDDDRREPHERQTVTTASGRYTWITSSGSPIAWIMPFSSRSARSQNELTTPRS